MPTTVEDLAERAEVAEDKNGLTAVRLFLVHDLGGNPESRVGRALLADGIPRIGQPHPGIGYLYVESRQAALVSGDIDSVKVTVNYKSPSPNSGGANDKWSIQTGSVVQEVETNYLAEFDGKGKKKLIPPINYIWHEVDGKDKPTGAKAPPGTGTVRVYESVLTWRMTRREAKDPMAISERYTSRVNKTTWQGKPPGTWLCSRIEGSSDDGGKTYTISYEFLYRHEGWTKDLVYVDPATGQRPPGVNKPEGNGVLRGQKFYFEEDFGPLNLSGSPSKSTFASGFTGL